MENVRKHRDVKLETTEKRRNYLVSELSFYTTECFTEKLLQWKLKKLKYSKINLSI